VVWKPEYHANRDPAKVKQYNRNTYERRKQRDPQFLEHQAAVQRQRYAEGCALWEKYKRTLEDYRCVLAEQGGGCAVCGKTPGVRMFHWDHDHRCCPRRVTCGKCVRGIVCPRCNMLIALVEAGPLPGVFAYLKRWGGAVSESLFASFGPSSS
jgi:hypothetical protein